MLKHVLSKEPHRDVLQRGIGTFTDVQWLLIDHGPGKVASCIRRNNVLIKRKDEIQYTRGM